MNKLIKLSDTHYIVVDDSEIKGDICLRYVDGTPFVMMFDKGIDAKQYKITHSTPIGGLSSMLEAGVKELSLSEVEELVNGYSVEKMADESTVLIQDIREKQNCKEFYISGFKAHQELTKDKLFTVEKAIQILEEESFGQGAVSRDEYKARVVFKLQSLLPSTEWDVEFDEHGKIKLL
jgi:hypothetical protein